MRPHRRQPTRLHCPWCSPGKNTGVGCHFLLQCRKVKSESEVAQSCPTLHDPMDCSLPGSSIHGIFQARVLEWGAVAFSKVETRGCYFISDIREGLSDNVTLYRLLKESCEYLGEHSRKREEHSERGISRTTGRCNWQELRAREVAEEIRSRRQVRRQLL